MSYSLAFLNHFTFDLLISTKLKLTIDNVEQWTGIVIVFLPGFLLEQPIEITNLHACIPSEVPHYRMRFGA